MMESEERLTPCNEEIGETNTETEQDSGLSPCRVGDTSVGENSNDNSVLSKKQLRQLKKWETLVRIRPQKRKQERARLKARKTEMLLNGERLGPSRKALKHNTMKDSPCRLRVVVDCSFDDLMDYKAINSFTQQLERCYSVNRRAKNPLQFYISNIGDKSRQRLETIGQYKGWDVFFEAEKFTEFLSADEIIYLTSESENVLSDLDDTKAYVIGGLVDHNRHKGLCHRVAVENGLNHAKLPINEFVDLKTRKVLTIDHVFEILLRFHETKSWEQAFFKVLPKRKGVVTKSANDDLADVLQGSVRVGTSNNCEMYDSSCETDTLDCNTVNVGTAREANGQVDKNVSESVSEKDTI